jgi:prepilin-type N-terminal cleavage/methylation domain-containing protein
MRQQRRGFSMMELLVVLIITGVIAGLSMSRFSAMLAQERVTKAAAGIANDLRMGFSIPGRVRRPVRIRVDTAAMMLLITDRAQSTTYRKTAFGSRYNLTGSNVAYYPSSSPLEIYPNGFASDTMSITLTSNGYTKRVRVTKGGMVQVK